MLLVQDNLIKLGGIVLSGQCKSIDISETATIDTIEDDKGKTKATQPTGYEAAKIAIDFILEDTPTMTQEEQIAAMQRLFRAYGQTKANLLEVVNEDCAARGISKVYFQKLQTKNNIEESRRTATLELVTPVIASITTKSSSSTSTSAKTASKSKKTAKKTSKKTSKKTVKTSTEKTVEKKKTIKFKEYSPIVREKQNKKAKLLARDLVL